LVYALSYSGGSIRPVSFESYVEYFLALAPLPGQATVMDNLTAHKVERVRELIEGNGCELLYLPRYSLSFNSIEEVFSKIKGFLRRVDARTKEALVEAMGEALDAVTPTDARGFFAHCGYYAPGQQL
jgi:transposase